MKLLRRPEYLAFRLITASWLGILSALFVVIQSYFFPHINTKGYQFSLVGLPLLGILWGFFRGYLVLLQKADELPRFPLRCVAGVWTGSLAYLVVMGLKINSSSVFLIIAAPGFLLGFFLLYRIFFWPTVGYSNPLPSFTQRVIAALYFGLAGTLVFRFFEFRPIEQTRMLALFVFLLSAYMGFCYACRVLLLPTSFRGFLRSMTLGVLGSSYILLIFLFIFLSSFLLLSLYQPAYFSLADLLTLNSILMFVVFPVVGGMVTLFGALLSLVFYLFSRIWAD